MIDIDYFHEDLMMLHLETQNQLELLTQMASVLHEKGYVKESFSEAVCLREQEFPTGLPILPYAAAIPHAVGEYVKKDGIAIATLKKPILFRNMGDFDEVLDTRIVFMLSIKKSEAHLNFLKSVVGLFQNQNFVERLVDLSTSKEAMQLIREHWN